ncbi:MAG: serine hydrolase [Phycisphaerae bacterium]|nr:serine hydrolase [Phycisphaerae bacterium]
MRGLRDWLGLCGCLFLAGIVFAQPNWPVAPPESQGLSSEKLTVLQDALAERGTKAFLVIRNDRIVLEWYASDSGPDSKHGTASMAKALVGGVSTALAIHDGLLSLDDTAARFIPQWRNDPRKSLITVRQLGSHTSGLADAEADNLPHEKLTGWPGNFWKRLPVPNDPFTISRDITPVIFVPGENFQYSNPGIGMLTYVVTAALRQGPHKDVRTLLRDRIMRPIGIRDQDWSIGYGQTFIVDGLPLIGSWGGGSYTARATARVGQLMLNEGVWEGRRLLSAESVHAVTQDAGTPHNGGIGWWSNNDGTMVKLPRDAYWGAGAGHQVVLVVPSLNLIVVRNGQALGTDFDSALEQRLFNPLMECLTEATAAQIKAPYPPSPVIRRIHWAPRETILRFARGCDNWPMTWADDDAMYGAYGDGNGFEPQLAEKLSVGLARVTGTPPDIRGENLRAPTLEAVGNDKLGRKASGLLCVDDVLYLWARNVGNAQLAWSGDHGKTWTWSDWKFVDGFGCPTFLDFGKNYAGARDDYVYVYSPDSDSAYDPADRMTLARVPKNRIRERAAYEFFLHLDPQGQPEWTRNLDKRGTVFVHPGNCYRSGITYHVAFRRYLWVQILPTSRHPQGPRFQGGFGIYDAPEPWGPWTTVFFTENWDVGPGETASFPSKWISDDGRTLYLVFSGDDCFSVRQAALELAGREKKDKELR